jgi:hypothetical protein
MPRVGPRTKSRGKPRGKYSRIPLRVRTRAECKLLATSQDGSVQPLYAATRRGAMQVGLIKVLREPVSSISPCHRTKLCTFFGQAGLAFCCEPRKVVRDMPAGLLVR